MNYWIVGIGVVVFVGIVTLFAVQKIIVRRFLLLLGVERKALEVEHQHKTQVLQRLAGISLGKVRQEHFDSLEEKKQVALEAKRLIEGEMEIFKTEMGSLDGRSLELERIAKELERSHEESKQLVDKMRAEEAEIAERNMLLKEQLDDSLSKIDRLLIELKNSRVAVERLSRAKASLLDVQERIDWLETEILMVNSQQAALKNSYDALDIEYAQLYERQSDM